MELLTEQVHTVWGQGNDKVVTLLSMDVARAFDTIFTPTFNAIDCEREKIPKWTTEWVHRSTTLATPKKATGQFAVRTWDTSAPPPLCPIHYFTMPIRWRFVTGPAPTTSAPGFVDDANIPATGKKQRGEKSRKQRPCIRNVHDGLPADLELFFFFFGSNKKLVP